MPQSSILKLGLNLEFKKYVNLFCIIDQMWFYFHKTKQKFSLNKKNVLKFFFSLHWLYMYTIRFHCRPFLKIETWFGCSVVKRRGRPIKSILCQTSIWNICCSFINGFCVWVDAEYILCSVNLFLFFIKIDVWNMFRNSSFH